MEIFFKDFNKRLPHQYSNVKVKISNIYSTLLCFLKNSNIIQTRHNPPKFLGSLIKNSSSAQIKNTCPFVVVVYFCKVFA